MPKFLLASVAIIIGCIVVGSPLMGQRMREALDPVSGSWLDFGWCLFVLLFFSFHAALVIRLGIHIDHERLRSDV